MDCCCKGKGKTPFHYPDCRDDMRMYTTHFLLLDRSNVHSPTVLSQVPSIKTYFRIIGVSDDITHEVRIVKVNLADAVKAGAQLPRKQDLYVAKEMQITRVQSRMVSSRRMSTTVCPRSTHASGSEVECTKTSDPSPCTRGYLSRGAAFQPARHRVVGQSEVEVSCTSCHSGTS
ncbi:hypothetical protein NP493_504g03073 [Ridgeia piscesae]|uniref:Uncharacterized protein n=1 Tax=Ridgeia piscesae TaxID=27915 RepID=A0AAD9KXM5_RIDPI|nr:hypothetical protein NP493_504g03073 [Ridgeia piscesae]